MIAAYGAIPAIANFLRLLKASDTGNHEMPAPIALLSLANASIGDHNHPNA